MSAPRPSPLPLPAPGPSAGAGWSWGVLVVLVGALVLVPNLEAGRLHPYDEAAMVDLARRMLDAGRYGFTVGDDGEYALAGFSKPPLALWLIAGSLRLLGANLFAVRLPFALCVLALGALATRWGRRLRPGREGLALGAVWGLLVVLAEGSLRYGGGRACIEPVLALFAASATYAFAHVDGRSARADRGWALLTGLLLGAAFLTKQVAAAMGALPVVGLALLRLRTSPRGAVTSLLLAAVPALAIALGYLMWLEETVGPEALDYLFGFSVVDRMGGFQGIRHFNWLNRFADLVDEVASPVPWALGLLGLVVLATRRRLDGGPAGKDAPGASAFAWGPLLLALTAVLAFDVVSRTVLEWYSFHLVFPLAGGAAFWLVRGTVRLAALRPDDRVDLRGAVELGAGAATALLIVDRSVEDGA